MSFDLRSLVDEALASSSDPDPRVITERVLAEIPARSLRDVVRLTLPTYVTNAATAHRMRVLSAFPPPEKGDMVGSRRWAAAAELLSARYVGADGKWKLLRDFTAADCLAAAADRRDRAAGLLTHAGRLEALAELVTVRGLSTVGELGEDEVRGVLAA